MACLEFLSSDLFGRSYYDSFFPWVLPLQSQILRLNHLHRMNDLVSFSGDSCGYYCGVKKCEPFISILYILLNPIYRNGQYTRIKDGNEVSPR
jgi:hypothetical protein